MVNAPPNVRNQRRRAIQRARNQITSQEIGQLLRRMQARRRLFNSDNNNNGPKSPPKKPRRLNESSIQRFQNMLNNMKNIREMNNNNNNHPKNKNIRTWYNKNMTNGNKKNIPRNKRVYLDVNVNKGRIRTVYNKRAINEMIKTGRTLRSPVTQKRFTRDNVKGYPPTA